MISTGDTASVLEQHPSRIASTPFSAASPPGPPPASSRTPLVAFDSTLALAAACAYGLKG